MSIAAPELHDIDALGLRIPLHGVQLIEASAGTGKTFTLATLFARLVVERGADVRSILAVTFTEAATRELRARLRARLVLAARIADDEAPGDDAAGVVTAQLVRGALARESAASLRTRLRLAAESMDLAPIHTIHGFCRRALAEHGVAAGLPPRSYELIRNERALRLEVATDFWRLSSRRRDDAHALLSLWPSPQALADDLRVLLDDRLLLPLPVEAIEDTDPSALDDACRALVDAFHLHGDAAREALRRCHEDGIVHRARTKPESVDAVWRALARWSHAPVGAPHENVVWYASDALAAKANKGRAADVPASPLFDAVSAWRTAREAADAALRTRALRLVHDARTFVRERLRTLKRERGLQGFDEMIGDVADALEGVHGDRFATALRTQYRVALVDEFQDTDARQWCIFRRLFAQADTYVDDTAVARALFLIGDPKQAIYAFRGGDVHAYLDAADTADARHALDRNFRSRPIALAATAALFARDDAFVDPRIRFIDVHPGGVAADADFQRAGEPAPGLTVLRFDGDDGRALSADDGRESATAACVRAICELLGDAGSLVRDGSAMRRVRPGDIAVLVERHDDGARMQRALAAAGVAAVAAGRSSLYDSDEAADVQRLLDALLAPADEERLRAALATPLVGLDARDIAALDGDETAHRHWLDRAQCWRERWEQRGVLALVSGLAAEAAPRLLQLDDGERRLANLLQLAEELQAASAAALGPAGLRDHLARCIAQADAYNDEELLRLESDAARVRILTVHASKGLEFDFVFVPYAATGGAAAREGRFACFHDGDLRVARLKLADDPQWADARDREAAERHAESLRLLYVAATRARLATWIAWGPVRGAHTTALAWLLHRDADAKAAEPVDDTRIGQRLQALAANAAGAVDVVRFDAGAPPPPRWRADAQEPTPPVAQARRSFDRDAGVHSFSALAREAARADDSGAHDELPGLLTSRGDAPRYAGPRFGNALHLALQRVDFAAWRAWTADAEPPEPALLRDCLALEGFRSDADQHDGVALVARLVGHTLHARLPDDVRLVDLPRIARRDEMAFDVALAPAQVDTVLRRLHDHGIATERAAFGQRRRLAGLLTGRIDLVFEHVGRCFVVDYKSNLLPDYGEQALARSMRESEYDLQYVLYTLALHRWLRFRLGARYDYDAHVGGVRYLYCRGMDARLDPSPGVYATRVPRALVEALDALFTESAAA